MPCLSWNARLILTRSVSSEACQSMSKARTVICNNGTSSEATTCVPGYYVTAAGLCAQCPGVTNATSVVCLDGTGSQATACEVGFYLSSGACLRMWSFGLFRVSPLPGQATMWQCSMGSRMVLPCVCVENAVTHFFHTIPAGLSAYARG